MVFMLILLLILYLKYWLASIGIRAVLSSDLIQIFFQFLRIFFIVIYCIYWYLFYHRLEESVVAITMETQHQSVFGHIKEDLYDIKTMLKMISAKLEKQVPLTDHTTSTNGSGATYGFQWFNGAVYSCENAQLSGAAIGPVQILGSVPSNSGGIGCANLFNHASLHGTSQVPIPAVTISSAMLGFNHLQQLSTHHGNYSNSIPLTEYNMLKFDGCEDVRSWISKCERVFILENTPQNLKVQRASKDLEGSAFIWHRVYAYQNFGVSWQEYSQAILKRFDKRKYAITEHSDEKDHVLNSSVETHDMDSSSSITSNKNEPSSSHKARLPRCSHQENEAEGEILSTQNEETGRSLSYVEPRIFISTEEYKQVCKEDKQGHSPYFSFTTLGYQRDCSHPDNGELQNECEHSFQVSEENDTYPIQVDNDDMEIEMQSWTLTAPCSKEANDREVSNTYICNNSNWSDNSQNFPQELTKIRSREGNTYYDIPYMKNKSLPDFVDFATAHSNCQINTLRQISDFPSFSRGNGCIFPGETGEVHINKAIKQFKFCSKIPCHGVHKILKRPLILIWGWYYKDMGFFLRTLIEVLKILAIQRPQYKGHPGTWIKEWKVAWVRCKLHVCLRNCQWHSYDLNLILNKDSGYYQDLFQTKFICQEVPSCARVLHHVANAIFQFQQLQNNGNRVQKLKDHRTAHDHAQRPLASAELLFSSGSSSLRGHSSLFRGYRN